jgi:EF hand domain-containing protein
MVAGPLFPLAWRVNMAQPISQQLPSFVKSMRPRNAAAGSCAAGPPPGLQDGNKVAGTPMACAASYPGADGRAREEETPMTRFLALISATLLAFTALADDVKDQTADNGLKATTATFEAMDKNADSQISRTEATVDSRLSDNFATLDTNGDGYISKVEFMARSRI